jgi:hypothetical protein
MTPDECRDFLVALANAADRSQSAGVRKKFTSLYRKWFREDVDDDDLEKLKWKYQEIRGFLWKITVLNIPKENPANAFEAVIAILRHKIRAVWIAAAWGSRADAEYQSHRLLRDITYHSDGTPEILEAGRWLCKNLDKLRVCQNPGCAGISTYFFRRWTNNKYCSETCTEQAQSTRRMERRETANAVGARHYPGEAHALVYISRWFNSVCAPPKPNFISRLPRSHQLTKH